MKLWGPQEGFALGFVSYLARPCSLVVADCCYFHFLYRLGTETPIWGANPDEDGVVYLLQDCPHLLHVSMCPGNESNVDRVFHFYSTFIQSAFCFFHLPHVPADHHPHWCTKTRSQSERPSQGSDTLCTQPLTLALLLNSS